MKIKIKVHVKTSKGMKYIDKSIEGLSDPHDVKSLLGSLFAFIDNILTVYVSEVYRPGLYKTVLILEKNPVTGEVWQRYSA